MAYEGLYCICARWQFRAEVRRESAGFLLFFAVSPYKLVLFRFMERSIRVVPCKRIMSRLFGEGPGTKAESMTDGGDESGIWVTGQELLETVHINRRNNFKIIGIILKCILYLRVGL